MRKEMKILMILCFTGRYERNGLRVGKVATVNNVETTTEYTLHGKLVTGLEQGDIIPSADPRLRFFIDTRCL